MWSKDVTPLSSQMTASPSMMHDRQRKCVTARAIGGKRRVKSLPAVERYPFAGLAGDDAEAVVLDLVNPQAAGRQCDGLRGEARRDKPGREGTLQHAG